MPASPATDGREKQRPIEMREVEQKYDIPPDFEVPGLRRFAGTGGRVDVDTVNLTSTYHDTAAMDLLRYRVTVRRRVGQADTGWQLKVPGAGFRTELHWPVRGATVPRAMSSLLAPFLNGEKLVAAVRLEVVRTRHRIIDADGALIAEVAQDDVRAVALGSPVRAARWHEVEAELGAATDTAILARLDRALRKAGAVASTSSSKLAHAIAGTGNEQTRSTHESAGDVLRDYVAAQADALVAGHFAIHQDAPDSVHQTRVGCRRLRSTLRTFAACYDAAASAAMSDEVRWYAEVLGAVRDLEVLRERLAAAIAELAPDMVHGPVGERIDARLATQLDTARAHVLAVQNQPRYAQLLARVVAWRDDPPYTPAAQRRAATLAAPLHHAEKVLRKRLDRATGGGGTDEEMHAARKAGKRARYAAEATGGEQSDAVKHAKKLQDLLGEFQDSVVAIELLNRLAAEARAAGEDTFSYGALVADQRGRADRARAKARTL